VSTLVFSLNAAKNTQNIHTSKMGKSSRLTQQQINKLLQPKATEKKRK